MHITALGTVLPSTRCAIYGVHVCRTVFMVVRQGWRGSGKHAAEKRELICVTHSYRQALFIDIDMSHNLSKTYASFRRSNFVVCTIVRCSEFSSCCFRDRCSFLTEHFVCPGVNAVSSCYLWTNQPVTGISNFHSSA